MSKPWEDFQQEAKPWEEFDEGPWNDFQSDSNVIDVPSGIDPFEQPYPIGYTPEIPGASEVKRESPPSGTPQPDNKKGVVGDFFQRLFPQESIGEFARDANPLGAVEGLGATGVGILSFFPALAVGAGEALKGLMAGRPIEGMAAAKDEMDRFMEAFAYRPRTKGGERIVEYASMPFMLAHEATIETAKSLGANEDQVKAAQFALDASFVALPLVRKKMQSGRKLLKRDVRKVKREIEKIDPTVDVRIIDEVMKQIEETPDLDIFPIKSTVKENQVIVDKLLETAKEREPGRRRENYKEAAQKVAEWEIDAKEADLTQISKREGKTRKLIMKLVDERDAVKRPVVKTPEDVEYQGSSKMGDVELHQFIDEKGRNFSTLDLEMDSIVGAHRRLKEKYGEGEVELRREDLLDRNKAIGSRQEPEIVKDIETIKIYQAQPRGNPASNWFFETLEEAKDFAATLEGERGSNIYYAEIAKSDIDKYRVPNLPDDHPAKQRAPKDAYDELYVSDDIRNKAKVAEPTFLKRYAIERSDAEIVHPKKKPESLQEFIRDEDGPSAAELLKEEQLLNEDLANLEAEIKAVKDRPEKQPQDMSELAQKFAVYRERSIEKFNRTNEVEVKKEDLAATKEDFKTFKSEEEALLYKESQRLEGDIITDPITGESFIEPAFKDLDYYGWDKNPDIGRKRNLDEADYELTDVGESAFWRMINNERGSIDITDLRIANEKLKEIQLKAEKMGKSVEEFLDMVGVSPETAQKIINGIREIPRMEEEIRKIDPVVHEIFNPTKEIFSEGRITNIPITKEMVAELVNAKKIEPGRGLGIYLDATEIRLNTFDRTSKKIKKRLYDSWVAKAADAKREARVEKREMKKDLKELSQESRERISIVAHSRQKNGTALLEKHGITEIPELTAAEAVILDKYQYKLASLRDRINYVRKYVGLDSLGKVDNYFPWIHQVNELRKQGIIDNELGLRMTNFAGHSQKFLGSFFPFDKRRTGKIAPIELDVFKAYEIYHRGAMKEIHSYPVAALAKEMAGLRVGKGKSKIKLEDINPGLHRLLIKWSDEIIGVDPAGRALAAEFPNAVPWLHKRMSNITTAILFGTVSTAMKQPLALIGVYADTGLVSTLYGISKLMIEKPRLRKSTEARIKSDVIEIRTMDIMLDDLANDIALGKVSKGKEMATKIAAYPMSFIDAMTAEAGWNAGYRFAKKKLKLNEREAIIYANDLVARTQGVGVRGAVSPIQTTMATKWMTLFQTFAINDFNYVARDLLGIRNPDKSNVKQVKRFLRYVAGAAMMNTLFDLIGFDAPKPAPVDKFIERKGLGDSDMAAAGQAALELIEILPMIGGAVKYRSSLFGPSGEFAKDIPEALRAVVDVTDWQNMTERELRNAGLLIGEVLGQWYGIPMTAQLRKSIKAAMRGGDAYEVILGLYVEEAKKKTGLPRIENNLPRSPRTLP